MSDDNTYSKRGLLKLGMQRLADAGIIAAELAADNVMGRFAPNVQRPPGAIAEAAFLMRCTHCNACVDACPPGAIMVLGEGAGIAAGTPFLDVNRHKPCVVCSHVPCIPACPTGALIPTDIPDFVMGTAVIDRDTCLSWNGEACNRCVEVCPISESATLVDPQGRVHIDPRACIGCGLCRAACPTDPKSITVRPPPRI